VLPGTDLADLGEQVKSLFKTEVLGIMTLNNEMVRMASSDIFVNRHPQHPFTQELTRIAQQLIR
jgi:MinD-like ATPase involved in chromosome partitioning or flagellar assembly